MKSESKQELPESKWPQDYFEQTYGALADDPLVRPEQGEYDERETVEVSTSPCPPDLATS